MEESWNICSRVQLYMLRIFEADPKIFPSPPNLRTVEGSTMICISEVIDIFTSEDMENTPPESWLWFRVVYFPVRHSCLHLRNRKHVPCFYLVIERRVEVWENENCCGNTSRGRVFPQLFRVLPI